jgi:hypothetical protein
MAALLFNLGASPAWSPVTGSGGIESDGNGVMLGPDGSRSWIGFDVGMGMGLLGLGLGLQRCSTGWGYGYEMPAGGCWVELCVARATIMNNN